MASFTYSFILKKAIEIKGVTPTCNNNYIKRRYLTSPMYVFLPIQ